MLGPLGALRDSVGRSSSHAHLASALRGIFEFHRRIVTRTGSLFAEPMLLVAYRECLARQDKGPQLSMAALADYIAAEQDLGRIDTTVGPQMAACLLMSSSFYRAFMEKFTGSPCSHPGISLPGNWLLPWHPLSKNLHQIRREKGDDSDRLSPFAAQILKGLRHASHPQLPILPEAESNSGQTPRRQRTMRRLQITAATDRRARRGQSHRVR
jgi:hypothetical protein